jgi:hypothetical protein
MAALLSKSVASADTLSDSLLTLGTLPGVRAAHVSRPMLGTVLCKERGVMLTLELPIGSTLGTRPRLGAGRPVGVLAGGLSGKGPCC